MSERTIERPAFTPQVRELLEGFIPEAINSGLSERYRVGLLEDPDISPEAREKILAESLPVVRTVWDEIMQAKLTATDPSYPLAVKKQPMLISRDKDGDKYEDFMQLYKVNPSTGEVLDHSLKGVFCFADEDGRFYDGIHIFGDFTYQDVDFVIRLYEAQESLGWRL
jgi:hypothetical protein